MPKIAFRAVCRAGLHSFLIPRVHVHLQVPAEPKAGMSGSDKVSLSFESLDAPVTLQIGSPQSLQIAGFDRYTPPTLAAAQAFATLHNVDAPCLQTLIVAENLKERITAIGDPRITPGLSDEIERLRRECYSISMLPIGRTPSSLKA